MIYETMLLDEYYKQEIQHSHNSMKLFLILYDILQLSKNDK